MATQLAVSSKPAPPSQLRVTGSALVVPLEKAVEALSITSDEDYELADELLTRIRQAEAKWENKINPVIVPQKQALDAAYALKNEFLHPLQAMEKAVKGEMKAWKVEQLRIEQEAEAEKAKELERLQQEEALQRSREAAAKTSPMKERLRLARESTAAQIAEVEQRPTAAAPVKVAGSQVRRKKKAQVGDLKMFLLAVVAGKVPLGLVDINQQELRMQYAAQPDVVASWPGVQIVDDIVIAGR